MEILGKYTVRTVKTEKLIKAPSGSWGEYTLELHDDGSFTYRPSEGQIINSPSHYLIWDPEKKIESFSFKDERSAVNYKEKLEKEHKRIFRMKKIFNSAGNGTLGEE